MFSRIVVPLDGSELAEGVLPHVRPLARKLGIPIVLLRVVDPVRVVDWADPGSSLFSDEVLAEMDSKAGGYLEKVAQPLRAAGLTVSCQVREGEPASAIVEEVEKEPNSLLAMSTHGRSGITRWVLGSVTDKVLRAINMPMLVIRPQEGADATRDSETGQVVLPVDGSPLAEQVVPHAVSLAKALGVGISVVRVTPSPADYYYFTDFAAAPVVDFSEEVDADARGYLREMAQRLRDEGVAAVEEVLLHGHPASALVDLVQERPNSLVTITTHGRSGITRWVLGSVTDRVVSHATVPVLVLRAIEKA